MPFTLSHAGFVLPFRRWLRPQVLMAVCVGSLTPDFGYFVQNFGLATFSHTILGAVVVALPIGLALYAAVMFLYSDFATSLPRPHKEFLRSIRPRGSTSPILIALAVLVGALSHNVADSFTHLSGYTVARVPSLQRPVFEILGETIPLFRILQYTGSVVGLLLLVSCYGSRLLPYCRVNGLCLWMDFRAWLKWTLALALTGAAAMAINLPRFLSDPSVFELRVLCFKSAVIWIPAFFVVGLCLVLAQRSE